MMVNFSKFKTLTRHNFVNLKVIWLKIVLYAILTVLYSFVSTNFSQKSKTDKLDFVCLNRSNFLNIIFNFF